LKKISERQIGSLLSLGGAGVIHVDV